MKTTIWQKVSVGKDRAIDELADMVNQVHGFFNLDQKERKRVMLIGRLLSMPTNSHNTLNALNTAGFINNEEYQFFGLEE